MVFIVSMKLFLAAGGIGWVKRASAIDRFQAVTGTMAAILGIVGATGSTRLLSGSNILGEAFVTLANVLTILFRVCYAILRQRYEMETEVIEFT